MSVDGHIRTRDAGLAGLVDEGVRRSSLFRALRDRLERSNVIVYLEHRVLPFQLSGRLSLIGASQRWRYIRIEIDCRQAIGAQIAALGHELQHAVEIADAAPSITDARSLQSLYGAIGFAHDGDRRQFESDAARRAGLRVRRELLAARD
jgi:hypothetical protein